MPSGEKGEKNYLRHRDFYAHFSSVPLEGKGGISDFLGVNQGCGDEKTYYNQKESLMSKVTKLSLLILGVLLSSVSFSGAQIRTGVTPLTPIGPGTVIGALEPSLRKWYVPHELYLQYKWQPWQYSNYAKTRYERYTEVELEGMRYYDIYGNYITKGWKIVDWTQNQPAQFGSMLYKHPYYNSWFGNVLVSSASKGQFYTAVTVGDQIRTTLTPLTFSKPAFNGLQWDFLTDKYAFTVLASRVSVPGFARPDIYAAGQDMTHVTNLYGFRGVVQVGAPVKLGVTYVNAHHENAAADFGANSLKGILSGPRNTGFVQWIEIKLSDDSPEDGEKGALLYSEEIWIDGKREPIAPFVEGGILTPEGLLEAAGDEVITLKYDIEHNYLTKDYKLIKNISFVLVLANDYRIEVTSNLQTNTAGEPVFLPVVNAPGNVKDGSNQKFVRFKYGLPTGNEVAGVSLEVDDLMGFFVRAEYVRNRRFRRFPNENWRTKDEQSLATDHSEAYYVTASKIAYPWFGYGEIFKTDYDYSTWMFVGNERGDIDYSDLEHYSFEFVDDNDDQDRFPDWKRPAQPPFDRYVFPGQDVNNDLVWDFNQNDNLQPDYKEPFLKYNVDPPQYLFGMDMNNNTVVDRFEDDHAPDYPFKKDHAGYNFYGGVEVVPNVKFTVGYLDEHLLSKDKTSRVKYGLFTLDKDWGGLGRLQIFDMAKLVKDNIPDDIYTWVQPPLSKGISEKSSDPLVCQNTFVNTAYLQFNYTGTPGLSFTNKLKYETYTQRGSQRDRLSDSRSFGIVNKADYSVKLSKRATFIPKWKSMYYYLTPPQKGALKKKELSEILFLIFNYRFLKNSAIELGYEGTRFKNFIERPASAPPDFVETHWGHVLAFQFTNISDYLGYQLTCKLGFRWEKLKFEYTSRTNSTIFVGMYAGARD
ncbi:MAG: hypothetical protein DRQ02_05145 [Candidatus Latescibacterota bacterium]|nr:MAG: hypothetical protein DRQ02_05145 [Candidatus Latescibacterota bacterium]